MEGGVDGPIPEFLICCSISKRICLWQKAFDLLNKMRYILLVVALLGACDVTNTTMDSSTTAQGNFGSSHFTCT